MSPNNSEDLVVKEKVNAFRMVVYTPGKYHTTGKEADIDKALGFPKGRYNTLATIRNTLVRSSQYSTESIVKLYNRTDLTLIEKLAIAWFR